MGKKDCTPVRLLRRVMFFLCLHCCCHVPFCLACCLTGRLADAADEDSEREREQNEIDSILDKV